jgi:hypothetical protein
MTTPAEDSIARVRRAYSGLAALYADSVVTEAADLLDTYLAAAEQRGYDREAANGDGYLTQAAAETASRRHGRPRPERTSAELHQLVAALRTAFTAEGLEVVPTPVRMGIGVAPLPGGPTWALGRGLAVALYADSGWELMLNSERTTSYTIYAPATAAGAADVAKVVHGVLRGDIADHFRRNY